MKTVWKASIPDLVYLEKEIEILLTVEHDNICKCFEVYETLTCVHFVMELISGGDLFDHIINSPLKRLEEKYCLPIFSQMIDAVHYLHCENIVHRDIKPENFLIYFKNNQPHIKLIDFGFATNVIHDKPLTDKVGTINYIAPEMLVNDSQYSFSIDVWALGICLFNMLAGKQPFVDNDILQLTEKIRTQEIDFNHDCFKDISKNSKNLIALLLEKDDKKRITLAEIKNDVKLQRLLEVEQQDTMSENFDPKANALKIKFLLNNTVNMKPIFWEFCIKNVSYELSKKIKEDFKSHDEDLFAQKQIKYSEMIELITKKAEEQNLVDLKKAFDGKC